MVEDLGGGHLPREPSGELRVDLSRNPSPAAKFDGADDLLTENPLRSMVFAFNEVQPYRSGFGTDHRHAEETRPHDLRRSREHPDRGHDPAARPDGLIEEIFEFETVDLASAAAVGPDGEAVDRGVGVQRASPSQQEEGSHEVRIGQENSRRKPVAKAISAKPFRQR
jgi:hypothetical protein